MTTLNARKLINWDMIQRYGVVVIFFALFIVNCGLTNNFFSMTTAWNLIIQAMPTIFISFGLTLVIAASSIDISVGSAMALGGVVFSLIIKQGYHPLIGLAVALLIGMFSGYICGILVSKFNIQPMITTMAAMYILRGLAKGISGGTPVSYRNPFVSSLSYWRLGGVVPLHFILTAILFIIIFVVLKKTRYGVYLEASGDNVRAARISGINTVVIVTVAHIISGALASFAGISLSVMVSSANGATLGLMYEANAIAATVVGGTPMVGGRPNLVGTLFGALLLTLIDMMVNMNNIYYAFSLVIKTLIIIGAVYIQKFGQSDR